jgi:perosamine synthetase
LNKEKTPTKVDITVPWWRTQLGDEEASAAADAVTRGKLSQGSITADLEARFAETLDVPYVTMTTSGTVALVMALVAAGVKAEDEVIVPDRTFIATAHAPQLLGARVRLADTGPNQPLMDPASVEKKITEATKAIIPVHLNGAACDMHRLADIAERHGLVLIEDAAQALFSRSGNRSLGTFGRFGCFSLGVTKLMTSGQGGFVIAHDEKDHQRLQFMRSHGVESPLAESFDHFGFNFRYTDIQAAVAHRQLDRKKQKIEAHQALFLRYREALSGLNRVQLVDFDTADGGLPLWVEAICEDRAELIDFLAERGIQARQATPNLSASPHLQDGGESPNSTYFERRIKRRTAYS